MKAVDLIKMSLEENQEYVARAVKGLTPDELAWRPKPCSNSIAFLLWHMARVEDMWINRNILGGKSRYEAEGWYKKFGTPAQDFGLGYDEAKLDAWPVPTIELLSAYTVAVREKTLAYLKTVDETKLNEPKDFVLNKATVGWALAHLVIRDRRALRPGRLPAGGDTGDRTITAAADSTGFPVRLHFAVYIATITRRSCVTSIILRRA